MKFNMKLIGILVFVIIASYAIYKSYSTASVDNDLTSLLKRDPIILDVRTSMEYDDGHIPGSVNIPLSRLRTVSLEALSGKRPVITCCSHGLRSIKAVDILQARGIQDVHNGGAWTDLEGKLKEVK